jgi:hypothetical protein
MSVKFLPSLRLFTPRFLPHFTPHGIVRKKNTPMGCMLFTPKEQSKSFSQRIARDGTGFRGCDPAGPRFPWKNWTTQRNFGALCSI